MYIMKDLFLGIIGMIKMLNFQKQRFGMIILIMEVTYEENDVASVDCGVGYGCSGNGFNKGFSSASKIALLNSSIVPPSEM